MLYEYAEDDQEIGVKMPKGSVSMLFHPEEARLVSLLCQVMMNAYKNDEAKHALEQLQSRVIRGDSTIN